MSAINLKNLIYPVCEIAIQAGKVINKYYKKKTDILLKEDDSPLTKADLESNQIINNCHPELQNGWVCAAMHRRGTPSPRPNRSCEAMRPRDSRITFQPGPC